MMTLMIAAAAAVAQPAAPAPGHSRAQHEQHMQMSQSGEHKGMDCCKDCCEHMAAKHDGQASEHAEHNATN